MLRCDSRGTPAERNVGALRLLVADLNLYNTNVNVNHRYLGLATLSVEDQKYCTRGGDGNLDGESMVPSINRPTLDLYRKSGKESDKTRYDRLIESRRALPGRNKGTRGTRGKDAFLKRVRSRQVYVVSLEVDTYMSCLLGFELPQQPPNAASPGSGRSS